MPFRSRSGHLSSRTMCAAATAACDNNITYNINHTNHNHNNPNSRSFGENQSDKNHIDHHAAANPHNPAARDQADQDHRDRDHTDPPVKKCAPPSLESSLDGYMHV
jgi:hypothetical protein